MGKGIYTIYAPKFRHLGMRRLYRAVTKYLKVYKCKEISSQVIRECMMCRENKHFLSASVKLLGDLIASCSFEKIRIKSTDHAINKVLKWKKRRSVFYRGNCGFFQQNDNVYSNRINKRKNNCTNYKKKLLLKHENYKIVTHQVRQFFSDAFIEYCTICDIKRTKTTHKIPSKKHYRKSKCDFRNLTANAQKKHRILEI